VNHVLSNKQNLKIAVIENEFGGGEWTDTYTHIHAHANKHTPAYTDTHTLINSKQKINTTTPLYTEVGIDDGLVMESKEEILEMNNGCVCCTGEARACAFVVCVLCVPVFAWFVSDLFACVSAA